MEISRYLDIVLPGRADKTIAEEAKRSEPKKDMFNIYIVAFLSLLTTFAIHGGWMENIAGISAQTGESLKFNAVANPVSAVATFAVSAVVAIISIWLLHWLVSGLGGKGKYENLFHVLSIFLVSKSAFSLVEHTVIAILSVPFGLYALCVVGWIAGIVSIYFIYLTYLVLKNTYSEIKTGNIILAMIGWYIITVAIGFAVGYIRIAAGI